MTLDEFMILIQHLNKYGSDAISFGNKESKEKALEILKVLKNNIKGEEK